MRDLTSVLPISSLDHREVLQVLLSFFGQAENVSRFVYEFSRRDHPYRVRVEASRRGEIKSVLSTAGLPQVEIEGMSRTIRECLLEGQVTTGAIAVLFSTQHRVRGYFQFRDEFQIRPLPEECPQPPSVVGDHAFGLLYPYPRSSDLAINSNRRRRPAVRFGRYLNLLLNPPIHAGRRFSEFDWAIDSREAGTTRSYWAQLGYLAPTLPTVALPLSAPPGTEPLPRVEHAKYYRATHAGPAHELSLPDNLESSLDRIFALSGEDRDRLNRAVAWLSQSVGIWRESGSGAYAALVIALEVLLEPRDPETCAACGQPKFAVMRRFREFLEEHVPDLDDHREIRDRLYSVRSRIVHGSEIFEQDADSGFYVPSFRGDDEMELYSTARQLARVAVVNWLGSRGAVE